MLTTTKPKFRVTFEYNTYWYWNDLGKVVFTYKSGSSFYFDNRGEGKIIWFKK